MYREIARAISEGRPAHPGFDTAVHFHQTLAAIERAARTGVRQPLAPPGAPRQASAANDHPGRKTA
jgi:predicted dehydrogenase